MISKKFIKGLVQNIPASIGCYLSFLPFKYRLGVSYENYQIQARNEFDKNHIFNEVKKLVEHAENNIEFYKQFYKKHDFTSLMLISFEDLKQIPIITKTDLHAFDFETRVLLTQGSIITNTGGTSGEPLKLLPDRDAHAREWAHMHTIWDKLEYKITSLKLTLRGMNLGKEPLKYNFIHNEFQVNAYCDFEQVVNALDKVLNSYKIEYLHGYPSGIYEFIKQLKTDYPELLKKLRKNIKGIFFGSEYPAPIYRTYIEEVLKVPTISWYGHTEMAVLAYEKEQPYIYHPYQSYGFTEAVELEGKHHLIGTTIHNKVGPLIRYDTGDLIDPLTYRDELLESFTVSQGRVGEFVTDAHGRNISLTALIFGRHHNISYIPYNFIKNK